MYTNRFPLLVCFALLITATGCNNDGPVCNLSVANRVPAAALDALPYTNGEAIYLTNGFQIIPGNVTRGPLRLPERSRSCDEIQRISVIAAHASGEFRAQYELSAAQDADANFFRLQTTTDRPAYATSLRVEDGRLRIGDNVREVRDTSINGTFYGAVTQITTDLTGPRDIKYIYTGARGEIIAAVHRDGFVISLY